MARQFILSVSGQANTAAADSIVVESPAGSGTGSPAFRIVAIRIFQPGIQTTAGVRLLQVVRKTTAGTGGVITARSTDGTGAYPGICRALPSPVGTTGAVLYSVPLFVPTALAAFVPFDIPLGSFGLSAPDGVANGIALIDPGAAGASGFAAALIFEEMSH